MENNRERVLCSLEPQKKANHRLTTEAPPSEGAPRPKGKPLRFGKLRIEHWQMISALLMLYDYMAITTSYFLALWLRFDGSYSAIPANYLSYYIRFTFIFGIVAVAIFAAFRLYNSMWRYASFVELQRILLASVLVSVLHTAGIWLIFGRMPISYYLLGAVFQVILITAVRFAYRFLQVLRKHSHEKNEDTASRVMLIGAGSAG